jgi:hypothetical protein
MTRFQIGSKYEYCPNGNYWEEISGVFDREIYLFCDCDKCKGQVYRLKPFNVTKKVGKEVIERARKFSKLDKIRYKINFENMESVEKLLKV